MVAAATAATAAAAAMRVSKRRRAARALCAALHAGVVVAHVLLSRHALRQSRATPAQLAALHAAATALALAFWTLFGLFRVRAMPFRALLPSALARAAQSVAHALLLNHVSLSVYVGARVLPLANGPTVALGLVALLVAERLALRVVAFVTAFILASMLSARLAATRLRVLFASELQLCLLTRALSATVLLPLAARDGMPPESATPVLCVSALLSFASFVSTRAMLSLQPARSTQAHAPLMCAFVPLLLVAALDISDALDLSRVVIATALFFFALHSLRTRARPRLGAADHDAPRWSWRRLHLAHLV